MTLKLGKLFLPYITGDPKVNSVSVAPNSVSVDPPVFLGPMMENLHEIFDMQCQTGGYNL